MQSSWDWTADKRFAEFLGDVAMCEALRVLIESSAVSTIRASYHDAYIRPLTERRLRALRSLVREGLVMAYWQGAGAGWRSEFGVGRFRVYVLA
jgi:hypothetical protein